MCVSVCLLLIILYDNASYKKKPLTGIPFAPGNPGLPILPYRNKIRGNIINLLVS